MIPITIAAAAAPHSSLAFMFWGEAFSFSRSCPCTARSATASFAARSGQHPGTIRPARRAGMTYETTMIRCIRLWSGLDRRSRFEEGVIDLESGPRGDTLSGKFPIASVSFQETNADPKLGWHPDPARQLVITLSG